MTDPTLAERYQAHRTRRFLRREALTRGMLPRWRTQRRRRALVLVLSAIVTAMITVGIGCLVDMWWALAWIPVTVAFLLTWSCLQVVAGEQGDAPRDALDERELAERDSARSIGLTVTQVLTFLPAIFLIVLGSSGISSVNVVYAGGLFVLTALIAGACCPTMILAWNHPDPDPDDHPHINSTEER